MADCNDCPDINVETCDDDLCQIELPAKCVTVDPSNYDCIDVDIDNLQSFLQDLCTQIDSCCGSGRIVRYNFVGAENPSTTGSREIVNSYSMPAGDLPNDGDKLRVVANYIFAHEGDENHSAGVTLNGTARTAGYFNKNIDSDVDFLRVETYISRVDNTTIYIDSVVIDGESGAFVHRTLVGGIISSGYDLDNDGLDVNGTVEVDSGGDTADITLTQLTVDRLLT